MAEHTKTSYFMEEIKMKKATEKNRKKRHIPKSKPSNAESKTVAPIDDIVELLDKSRSGIIVPLLTGDDTLCVDFVFDTVSREKQFITLSRYNSFDTVSIPYASITEFLPIIDIDNDKVIFRISINDGEIWDILTFGAMKEDDHYSTYPEIDFEELTEKLNRADKLFLSLSQENLAYEDSFDTVTFDENARGPYPAIVLSNSENQHSRFIIRSICCESKYYIKCEDDKIDCIYFAIYNQPLLSELKLTLHFV